MGRFLFIFLFFPFLLVATSRPLQGIVLIGDPKDLIDAKNLKSISGVVLNGIDPPEGKLTLEQTLSCDLGQPLNQELARRIKRQIYQYYRDNDRPLVLIAVPKQKTSSGVLQIVVTESKVGEVRIVGNEWTKKRRYENYLGLKPGQTISQSKINREVDFMNRSPFRAVAVSYSPGEKEFTTDLTLQVTDRKPYFFYAGFENTGVPTTGRQRVFLGFGWDQIFEMDQSFFYQYTTNYSGHKFHSSTFQYTALCSWEAILNVYGGISTLHANLKPSPVSNRGTNIQASLRYTTPLRPTRYFQHEFLGGCDIKNTNNTVEFSDTVATFGQTVNMSQFMMGYKCRYEVKDLWVEGGLEGYCSPFEWLPGQSLADFGSLRPDANNKWVYFLGFCTLRHSLPHACSFHFKFRGEWSPYTLLPSEQIGLGGHASVRGYDERQYNGDSGFIMNAEFHTPSFPFFTSSRKDLSNQAYFLLFSDGGVAFDNNSVPMIPIKDFLVSIGAGFRYYMGPYFNAKVDYGIKLHHQAEFTNGPAEVHFSVTGSY